MIPAFLHRVDREDRGVAWSRYLAETASETAKVVEAVVGEAPPAAQPGPSVRLTEFDPAGEDKVLTAIAYPNLGTGEAEVAARVARLLVFRAAAVADSASSAGTPGTIAGGRSRVRTGWRGSSTASTTAPGRTPRSNRRRHRGCGCAGSSAGTRNRASTCSGCAPPMTRATRNRSPPPGTSWGTCRLRCWRTPYASNPATGRESAHRTEVADSRVNGRAA